jgi:hypothetical protein
MQPTEPIHEVERPAAMLNLLRPLTTVALVALVAACAGGGAGASPDPSAGGSGSPTETPANSPDFGTIDHPTGPTDVVLRFEEGGGFMMPAFLATQAPGFTLYGDGTIIFRNPLLDPPAAVGSVFPMHPFRTAKLTEDQVQDLLTSALGEFGLGVARPEYRNDLVADAGTAVFTVNAGGLNKTVSVYALGLEGEGVPDAAARAGFAKLAERLQDIDSGGAFATTEYEPERYRGILLDGQPGVPDAMPWPWPAIAPSDFVSNGDPNAFQLPARVMSAEEVEVLGIEPYAGGFSGLTLLGPDDGKVYSFSLRPLLPDEVE